MLGADLGAVVALDAIKAEEALVTQQVQPKVARKSR